MVASIFSRLWLLATGMVVALVVTMEAAAPVLVPVPAATPAAMENDRLLLSLSYRRNQTFPSLRARQQGILPLPISICQINAAWGLHFKVDVRIKRDAGHGYAPQFCFGICDFVGSVVDGPETGW